MSEILGNLLSKYGLGAITGGMVAVFIVWFAGHNMSAPGKRVVVFWGLIEYTKMEDQLDLPVVRNQEQKVTIETEATLKSILQNREPISIDMKTVSQDDIINSLVSLRKDHSLRKLTAMESGKKIKETAKGTYFFTLDAWLESDTDNFESEIQSYAVRANSSQFNLEIHKANDNNLYLVGFVSHFQAAEISHLDGITKAKIVFSEAWNPEFTTLVRIPAARVLTSEKREIDISDNKLIGVLDIELQ